MRKAIKEDLVSKNPSIQNLKQKLSESKAETKAINKGFVKKSNKLNTYADQRVSCLWEFN